MRVSLILFVVSIEVVSTLFKSIIWQIGYGNVKFCFQDIFIAQIMIS